MIEFLRSIKGPDFLIYYSVYSIITLTLLCFAKSFSITVAHDSNTDVISPYMAAFMKMPKNINNFICTIITELYSKKLIDVSNTGGKPQISIKSNIYHTQLNIFEKILVDNIDGTNSIDKILKNKKLKQEIIKEQKNIQTFLIKEKYIVSSSLKTKLFFIKLFFGSLLFIPGVLKFLLGFTYNKPIGFLFVLLLINFILFIIIGKVGLLTSKGKGYLMSMKSRLESSQIRNDSTAVIKYAGYFTAILGIGGLLRLSELGVVSAALTPYARAIDSARSSGCSGCSISSSSSGCSSSSSGCSSSGCSSSGCGGGCGGCGGGGD